MDYDHIKYELIGRIGVVTLNRPENQNAMNDAMMRDLEAALKEVEKDTEIWVVVIKGMGESFCVGEDLSLKWPSDVMTPTPTKRWAQALSLIPTERLAIAKEGINGTLDITGLGNAFRNHYNIHLALQFIRFRPHETNLYKTRRDKGLKGFIQTRAAHATPGEDT